MDTLVTKGVGDTTDSEVELVTEAFLAQFDEPEPKPEPQPKQKEEQAETEEEENLTMLAKNIYTVRGQDISLILEQNDEGKSKFTLTGDANTEAEAKEMLAYAYGIMEDGSMDAYSIFAFIEDTEMWATAGKNFDGTYTLAGVSRDGSASFFKLPDWVLDETVMLDDEESDSYLAEVQSAMLDFFENWQSYPPRIG